ncbi:hypothetical protein B0H19DRAFT_1065474 [Mycena capillaripes]|nr:hypothetical protein B0H19DRAFT_1065474 [Mycena capillaripes]
MWWSLGVGWRRTVKLTGRALVGSDPPKPISPVLTLCSCTRPSDASLCAVFRPQSNASDIIQPSDALAQISRSITRWRGRVLRLGGFTGIASNVYWFSLVLGAARGLSSVQFLPGSLRVLHPFYLAFVPPDLKIAPGLHKKPNTCGYNSCESLEVSGTRPHRSVTGHTGDSHLMPLEVSIIVVITIHGDPGIGSSKGNRWGLTIQTTQPLPRSNTNSDWLWTSLIAARTITAAAESVPYLKGVFGIVVILLETLETVKKNREDLKELCGNVMEIVTIVREQISFHGDTAAVKFKDLCGDLEECLHGVLSAVKELARKPSGLHGRFKEIIRGNKTADEIAGYGRKIRELRSNFVNVRSPISAYRDYGYQLPSTQGVNCDIAP